MDERPYTLVNMKIWRKTRYLLRAIQKREGGSIVHLLHRIVEREHTRLGLPPIE